MNGVSPLKTVKTGDGREHKIAKEMSIKNKKYIVTIDRNVLIEDESGNIVVCPKDDEIGKEIYETLKPAKSLDIEDEYR